MRGRMIRCTVRAVRCTAWMVLLSLLLPCHALAALSWDRLPQETYGAYTLGDLAAARFAVYGLLPERYRTPQEDTSAPLSRLDAVQLLYAAFAREGDPAGETPFPDVDAAHREAVSWAYSTAVAGGCSPTRFGIYPVTEQAFVTMLLNALGFRWKFTYADALDFAQSVGLSRPIGCSDAFSQGDAMLYLQEVLSLSMPEGTPMRLKLNIPQDMNAAADCRKLSFPAAIALYPASIEDAEAQLELATRFLPDRIDVYCGPLTVRDARGLYERLTSSAEGGAWYISRIVDDSLSLDFEDLAPAYTLTDEELAAYDAMTRAIRERRDQLSLAAYLEELDTLRVTTLTNGKALSLRFNYNEAWTLACDRDDAFAFLADGELSQKADRFYQQYVARARNDRDAVKRAERAVKGAARYAESQDVRDGSAYYFDDTHSILGFFQDGEIVCEGYAKVFQYLMIRADVPCVVVSGSTRRTSAEQGKIDHAWNKVFVDGKWLNVDVCWNDTGWGSTFLLRSDSDMPKLSHWPVTHTALR